MMQTGRGRSRERARECTSICENKVHSRASPENVLEFCSEKVTPDHKSLTRITHIKQIIYYMKQGVRVVPTKSPTVHVVSHEDMTNFSGEVCKPINSRMNCGLTLSSPSCEKVQGTRATCSHSPARGN